MSLNFMNLNFSDVDAVVILVGDSLSADNATMGSWMRYAKALYDLQGRRVRFIDLGVDGGSYFGARCDSMFAETADLAAIRIEQSLYAENLRRAAASLQPLIMRVICALGTNDAMLNTRGVPLAESLFEAKVFWTVNRSFVPGIPFTYIEMQLLPRTDTRQPVQDFYTLSDQVKGYLKPGDNWFAIPVYRFRDHDMLLNDGAAMGNINGLGILQYHMGSDAMELAGAMFAEKMGSIPGFEYQLQPYLPWGSAFSLLDAADSPNPSAYSAWRSRRRIPAN